MRAVYLLNSLPCRRGGHRLTASSQNTFKNRIKATWKHMRYKPDTNKFDVKYDYEED